MAKAKKKAAPPPQIREPDRWLLLEDLLEAYARSTVIEKSYVLSRFWAWWSKVQIKPEVRIPVPRYFSYRDP